MRRLITLVGVLVATAAASGTALAAWSANSTAASGSAKALSMPAGNTPTAPATSTGSVTLTWTAATLAGSDLTTYNVKRYAGTVGTAITCAPQTITSHVVSCTYTESTAGSYTYTDTPTQQLWVGSESAKSGITVVAVDSTPPAVTLDTVATPTNNAKPAFAGSYGSAVGDNAAVTVQVHAGSASGTVVATPTATVNAVNHRWSTSALSTALSPDGIYVVVVSQSDLAGNTGTASATFVLDTTAPAPKVTNPTDGSTGVASGTVTISGTAGTATGDATTVTVSVTVGTGGGATTTTTTATVNQTTGAWSITQSINNNKAVSVTVTQTDSAANSGSATTTFHT